MVEDRIDLPSLLSYHWPPMAELTLKDIQEARERIRETLPITPLTYSKELRELTGRDIFCKWDNKFKTGSFKERGAVNTIKSLVEAGETGGICAASAGNHALALSHYSGKHNLPCKIVMPLSAPLVKVQKTRATGAEVILNGSTLYESTDHALEISHKESLTYISPFDNHTIMAGQGTAGLEILDQLDDFDSVIVPVGGGGYISGISTALKESGKKDVFVLGVQSEWAVNYQSGAQKDNRATIQPTTIADGIAVKKIGKLTAPVIEKYVDELVTIQESEIADAVIQFLEREKTLVEGAGASGLAAVLAGKLPEKYKRPVILVCGSNIDINVLARLIERDMRARGRLLNIDVSVPDRPGSLHTTAGLLACAGANVLSVLHDRAATRIPGNVHITFHCEVIDEEHKQNIVKTLEESGIKVERTEDY